MLSTKEIIREAQSLPVQERAIVVDSLLQTLNAPDPEINREWTAVAKRRLAELRSGRVKPVPADTVLAQARERFEKHVLVPPRGRCAIRRRARISCRRTPSATL